MGRNDKTLRDRLEELSMPEPNTGCWLWFGCLRYEGGYGVITVKKRKFQTHRVAYEIYKGPIPDGMCIMHSCDTPRCVNPDHLSVGTWEENVADKKNKGRQARGSGAAKAKITERDVQEIRARRAAGEDPRTIANVYGIASCSVSNISARRSWKHVP